MIAPARPGITRRLVVNQPSQGNICLVSPRRVAGRLMKTDEATSQKAHALGGTAPGNPQQRAHVDGEAAHSLLERDTQELVIEGQRAQEPRAQPVESIVAAVVVPFQPTDQPANRVKQAT